MEREETVSTIQVDFQGPLNFDLKYIAASGKEERPVILHRAPLSTHERFVSFLIEYYGGCFPVWMAPIQAMVIPISPVFNETATEFQQTLRQKGYRASIDKSDQSFSKKIRIHLKKKTPVLLILGEKEIANKTVTMRRYGQTEQETLTQETFLNQFETEIKNRLLPPHLKP